MKSKVHIVGAGPGSADLLTLRAIKAIQNADVILYDALICKETLDFASPKCELIYVGKRAARHEYSQEKINQLIVENAFRYQNVVRLKGGDPYIFGRGHEEYEYVSAFGIEVAVIPGISSAIAVPELENIPLTKRGVSESFWVVTATNKKGELTNDLKQTVHSNATIVVLMGVSKLSEIVAWYSKNGKGNLPIAVIQNGSLSTQKIVSGTIKTIENVAKRNNIGTPAIIILGEVVALRPEFLVEKSNYNKNRN
ncbi:MAG: uroporphyrinogen-III C-methyltransferase [Bacteroidetes bacterium RIFCSPLOWO2_12_FULL_31_6]|nr:MAG: uroporphyrinogen-III C-methyltransferase [Bacteroidetes bacterium RIFCSPLOWO2_12_FULL_31_6]